MLHGLPENVSIHRLFPIHPELFYFSVKSVKMNYKALNQNGLSA